MFEARALRGELIDIGGKVLDWSIEDRSGIVVHVIRCEEQDIEWLGGGQDDGGEQPCGDDGEREFHGSKEDGFTRGFVPISFPHR